MMAPDWRPMRASDLRAVLDVSNAVHPDLPEGEAVFAERLALFPEGCLVLADGATIEGYALSHPIRRFRPPALNSLLGALPADADDYYIHDVVVAPWRRGGGHAAIGVRRLLAIASAYETTSLVSVYGTAAFWARFGFRPASRDMAAKLRPYGANAVYMLRRNQGRNQGRNQA